MRYATLAVIILLAGCKGDVIHLKDEKTGEEATCGGELTTPGTTKANVEHCLKVFRAEGFTEVPQEAK